MTEIHIFPFFPPNRSDKEWQLCTTEGPTPVFKRFGGKGRAIDGRNIYFLFSYFFPNMSGISVFLSQPNSNTGNTANFPLNWCYILTNY